MTNTRPARSGRAKTGTNTVGIWPTHHAHDYTQLIYARPGRRSHHHKARRPPAV